MPPQTSVTSHFPAKLLQPHELGDVVRLDVAMIDV
jgi:hypothetical protein